jgi:hypothetical protein
MTTLHMKIGSNELLLESSAALSADEVQGAISAFERFRDLLGSAVTPQLSAESDPREFQRAATGETIDASIDMFVSRLGGDSSRAILKAAAAHLTLAEGHTVFTRDAWFERAQQAHEWRAEFSKYRTRDIRRMVSAKEIIEKQGGMYALTPRLINELRPKVSDD